MIIPSIEKQVYEWTEQELKGLKCHSGVINGVTDHIHVSFELNWDKSLQQVFKQIKGAVSRKMNKSKLLSYKFSWQIGYGALSVSLDRLHAVERYIHNQKEHHKKETFKQEYQRFMRIVGLVEGDNSDA